MDRSDAIERLRFMVAAADDPSLDDDELHRLLDEARQPDPAGNPHRNDSTAGTWAASTAVLPGTVIAAGARYWRCVIGGTTAATVPSWPDLGGTAVDAARRVGDGDVVWADNGTTWAETYNLDLAAMLGWERKAGKAAGRYDFSTDDQRFQRAQVAAHCWSQADRYRRRTGATTQVKAVR